MTGPAEWGVDLGTLVPSTVVGEVVWAMDHPDEDDDGGSSVSGPVRPLNSPPSLAAEADPTRE